MSLIQFLRILMARKAIILATVIVSFIAATITVFMLPERYEASNRVLIDMTRPGTFVEGMSRDAVGSYISTQLKLAQDVQTAGLVVDSLGWTANPANQAAFEAAGRPGGDIRDWLAQQIVANTEAQFVPGSSIVEIRYQGRDPAATQGIAEALREAFLSLTRNQRITVAQRSAASFEQQARRALDEVNQSERERAEFARANGIVVQPGNIDLETAKLGALSSATAVPVTQQAAAAAQVNPMVTALRQQIITAQASLGPNHPQLQAMRRQLSAMESDQVRGAPAIRGSNLAEIESAFQTQKARVLAQADKIDRLNQLQADIDVKRGQYQRLLGEAEQMKSMALAGVTPMEPLGDTNLPNKPVWPNKPLVMLGSLLLGGALGVFLALLVELLARRVRSEDDLEFASGVPVLAVIGQQRADNALLATARRVLDRDGASKTRALAEV